MIQVRSSWTDTLKPLAKRRYGVIAILATVGIATHLLLRFGTSAEATVQLLPLWAVLCIGGIPLTFELFGKLIRGNDSPMTSFAAWPVRS